MEDMLNYDAELLLDAINTTETTFKHWKGAKHFNAKKASADLDDAVTTGLNLQCDVRLPPDIPHVRNNDRETSGV